MRKAHWVTTTHFLLLGARTVCNLHVVISRRLSRSLSTHVSQVVVLCHTSLVVRFFHIVRQAVVIVAPFPNFPVLTLQSHNPESLKRTSNSVQSNITQGNHKSEEQWGYKTKENTNSSKPTTLELKRRCKQKQERSTVNGQSPEPRTQNFEKQYFTEF